MTNEILLGKLETENSHVRFEEGGITSAKSRRESLLCKKVLLFLLGHDIIHFVLRGVAQFG